MQQAWHIFKKDLLFLRLETINYLVAIVAAGWVAEYSSRISEILVAFTGAYLIAQLIHADAPAGDRQFWITRPYRWTSLLGAKLLFILAVVDLPVCLAQWIILIHEEFAFPAIWHGLLWEQFLWFFGIYLPVAAIAALTTGMVPFLSFALVAILVDIGVAFGLYRPEHSLRGMEWIRSSVGFITLLATSAIVVWLQYKKRRTVRSRWIAFSILICGIAGYIFTPWSLAFAIQERFSRQPVETSSLSFALDSGKEQFGLAMSKGKRIPISVPMVVHGLSPGAETIPESLQIALQATDGRVASLNPVAFSVPQISLNDSPDLILNGSGELDRGFFEAERDRPVILHGSLYLTIFGNRRTHTIFRHWIEKPLDVTRTLRCYIGQQGMACVSPFRWPNQWVGVARGASTRMALYYGMSYSPFPADLRFYPFDRYWAPPPVAGAEEPTLVPDVSVDVEEPIAYVRRDFEIRDMHLSDIALPWHSQRVMRDGKSVVENEY